VLCENDGSFVGNVILRSKEADTITATFDSNAQNEDEGNDVVNAYGFDVQATRSGSSNRMLSGVQGR